MIRMISLALLCCLTLQGLCLGQAPDVTDNLTRELFETYVVRPVKVNTSTVLAASHIVAERGRESGYWKVIFAELKKGNEQSELGCVRVLGKMLAIDATARDAIRRHKETGELSAWVASVKLSPDVVTELIERGRKADRFRIDHYAIALAQARVPAARPFFESILVPQKADPDPFDIPNKKGEAEQAPTPVRHSESTRFHAAVGLAQLGDAAGVNWLIANCEYSQGRVENVWPYNAPRGGDLSACCQAVLEQLSGENLTGKAEWTAWSNTVDKSQLAKKPVHLVEPGAPSF